MFAIDERYQHLPYSAEKEDGTFSDYIFRFVISKIYEFTEEICGADKVILYAVPKAKNFYEKNGFTVFPAVYAAIRKSIFRGMYSHVSGFIKINNKNPVRAIRTGVLFS